MNPPATEFVFVLTNPGSEKPLKNEMSALRPDWRPAYQRRGFVTFKAGAAVSFAALDAPAACARRLCLSLGKMATRDEAVRLIDEALGFCPKSIVHHARYHDRKMQGVSGGGIMKLPELGQFIGTVVELRSNEFWAGLHRHLPHLSPDPAGDAGCVMPPESPSRAWLKLEEAIRFFGLKFSASDIVVELGCAPGGVALALLERGISVIGVDPADMAAVVRSSTIEDRGEATDGRPWFWHCRKPAALVSKRDLGHGVTWFMSDMNQTPEVVLAECARFCRMAPTIRSVLITLKLTDLGQVAEKAQWLDKLSAMGFTTARLQQFSVHHKEFALLAFK